MTRQEHIESFIKEMREILANKGHDYAAGSDDPNANFKIIAQLLEGAPITPYTVCMIYALKHVCSLITFCKTGKQESGESLRGRHLDMANYSAILDTLVEFHDVKKTPSFCQIILTDTTESELLKTKKESTYFPYEYDKETSGGSTDEPLMP